MVGASTAAAGGVRSRSSDLLGDLISSSGAVALALLAVDGYPATLPTRLLEVSTESR